MNEKITLPELVDAIANHTNTSKKVSELFLKEFFGVIKERLEQGETVKIKGLGVFKVTEITARKSINVNNGEEMEIAAHRRVSFTADKSLAEAINTPFEEFETVILDDDISDEDLNELVLLDNEDESVSEVKDRIMTIDTTTSNEELVLPPPFIEESENISHNIKSSFDSEEDNDELKSEYDGQVDSVDEDKTDTYDIILDMPSEASFDDETEYVFEDDVVHSAKRTSFVWGVVCGAVVSVVAILVAWCVVFGSDTNAQCDDTYESVVAVQDTFVNQSSKINEEMLKHEEVMPVQAIVIDTVRTNYFLTKMSRKYYGRYEFWVYIYEENKAKISNPNSVSPGLVVVIPPADKYGINKDDPESVRKAENLAEKILRK